MTRASAFSARPLRFFYVPNEGAVGDQIGPRLAFEALHAQGVLAAYTAYSYLVERQKFADHAQALADLHAAVLAFQPDVIFFQHLNHSYPVDRAFLERLKAVASKPKFIWHDADAYGHFIKPFDATMKTALGACDMAILVGLGDMAAQARRAGAPRVLFAPHSYDDTRSDRPWQPTLTRRFNALMIANLTCLKRVPFLFMPGGRTRKQMARAFHAAHGERFAVYGAGQGWRCEPYCLGPIAFDAQERTMRTAWLTVNWGQFDAIPMYSSDRLPISMASGVAHITNHQPGYELAFPNARGVFFVHSAAEALDVADWLLSLPREQLIDIGAQGAAYARERLNAKRVYADIVSAIGEQLFGAPCA